MTEYFKNAPEVLKSINAQKEKLTNNRRYCTLIYERMHKDFQEKMLEISKEGWK